MAKITVRFNYFRLYLQNENEEALYEFNDLLKYINRNREKNYSMSVNMGNFGEIDTNAFHYDDDKKIYYLQIAKLRNENLPEKKRVSEPREDLPLEPDEFVSEFLTLIYDEVHKVAIVQVNRSSLSVKELEIYLTQLRNWKRREEGQEIDDYYVQCRIVPDPEKLNDVKQADYIRKISLRGSKVNIDALQDDQSLKKISDTIGKLEGVNFKLEISVERHAPKESSLNKNNLLEIIEEINNNDNGIKSEVTIKEDIDTSTEIVNLVNPRMTDIIKLEHNSRRNIGVEFLYRRFMEDIYIEKRKKIERLLD